MARDKARRTLSAAAATQLKELNERAKKNKQTKQPDSDTKGNPDKSPSKRDSKPCEETAVKPPATETNIPDEGEIEDRKPAAVETAPKTPPSVNRSTRDISPSSRGSPSQAKSRRDKKQESKKESLSIKTDVSFVL